MINDGNETKFSDIHALDMILFIKDSNSLENFSFASAASFK